MKGDPLLIEIGCEEIPARMIAAGAEQMRVRVVEILDRSGLAHGDSRAWGGSRRLAVRVESVAERQDDREEEVLGPPAAVAFDGDGRPTRAAEGFASKQGIPAERLERRHTDRGEYVGYTRQVPGRTLERVLADSLEQSVGAMAFPKTMRWADGTHRWVRPVHWLLALHGRQPLDLTLFGIRSRAASVGHRFLAEAEVPVEDADAYADTLERSNVLVDPRVRRERLAALLAAAAHAQGGTLVVDDGLLDEVADLVEWPGVVAGRFDPEYLELPAELLATALRHHQKCFSVCGESGEPLARFVAVTNTDRDRGEHIRRGNEWVIGGRLDDARFFWREDTKLPLSARSERLARVVFHKKAGTYADKAARMSGLAGRLAEHLALDATVRDAAIDAARLAKNDLVTSTVGEFPELQGQIGGLMLEREGESPTLARAVYEHYLPAGTDDPVPTTPAGALVGIADKLDTVATLIGAGESPTGSRDPLGLRRATTGVFRTVVEHGFALAINDLARLAGSPGDPLCAFLLDRLQNYCRESGWTVNEVQAVLRPRVSDTEALDWPLPQVTERLRAIEGVRQRDDFAHLADLTKRVDNILTKKQDEFERAAGADAGEFEEHSEPALSLWQMAERGTREIDELERQGRYPEIVDALAGFVGPVERFFDKVLVLDPDQPAATLHRRKLLEILRGVLTRSFDIRELAGQTDRRAS